MKTIKNASVKYHGRKIGTIALFKGNRTAFQYESSWIRDGFSISPISLPLSDKVFEAPWEPFDGLFGVFDDCLPDGWGRLLADRYLRSQGIEPSSVNPITRMTLLSSNGLGALEFEPIQYTGDEVGADIDFDELKSQCDCLLQDSEPKDLDMVFSLGGSSGGARPKAHVNIEGNPWIVKFPSSFDIADIGEIEYLYNLTASRCGLEVPETRLIASRNCSGFFASKRFDRDGKSRIHMVSAGGLLESSHRYPGLDYNHLFKLSNYLSRGTRDFEAIFTLMCFNEYAHNRDDHSKNFSFLYSETKGWYLSPAYDLTYSNSLNGEHATTINGKGLVITDEDIRTVGMKVLKDRKTVDSIMEKVKAEVESNLGHVLHSVVK